MTAVQYNSSSPATGMTNCDQPPIVRHSLSIQQDETVPTGSSSSINSYHDQSTNDLTLITGAILLTADCMGTGILALPADVHTLGRGWGVGFLLLNLPINLYAGTILGWCALYVEERILGRHDVVVARRSMNADTDGCDDDGQEEEDVNRDHNDVGDDVKNGIDVKVKNDNMMAMRMRMQKKRIKKGYSSVDTKHDNNAAARSSDQMENEWNDLDDMPSPRQQRHHVTDTATFDVVGMTSMLFDAPILPTITETFVADAFDADQIRDEEGEDNEPHDHHHRCRQITYRHPFTKVVLVIYYVNLFLVLGNYILVMSHAVSAMAGENNLCIPTAGIIASTLMFAFSQLRTMAHLGRSVSAVSLLALLIVVVQCLYSLQGADEDGSNEIMEEEEEEYASYTTAEIALAKMSSLAAIGFAVGSQKLLLNIRHEMVDRTKAAPGALSISLSLYGLAYVIVCLLAGPHPPSFLFDAIPDGWGRRVAGFLLWVHVAVSYAINSQALCSSVDRIVGHRLKLFGLDEMHGVRWLVLTALVALSSYLVANAVPFFKIFYRRVQGVPLFFPTINSKFSFVLVFFSLMFMVIGLIGALGSIDVDWLNKAGPFACH
ncbi:hypothetical protein ACHAXR_012056 [Thalassiosira sp. AJA248-18]